MKDFTSEHPDFKIGNKIQFKSGYNDDINFKTEILGFDKEGYIYMLTGIVTGCQFKTIQ